MCQPQSSLAWFIAMDSAVLLPVSAALVSSTCSIQSNSDPDRVPPLLRNVNAPPPGCSKSQSVLQKRAWTCLPSPVSSPTPLPSFILSHTILLPNMPQDACLRAFALQGPVPGLLSPNTPVAHASLSYRSLLFVLPEMPTTSHPPSALSDSFFFSFQSHFLLTH